MERLLLPSEVAFADGPVCLRTILGSCIAVTFWHPGQRVGAMCHFLVPERLALDAGPRNGKYGDDAIGMIAQHFRAQGLPPESFVVQIFGGGNMFPGLPLRERKSIGEKNVEAGKRHLEAAGFQVQKEDLAGQEWRVVVFNVQSGEVQVRRGASGSGIAPVGNRPDR